MEEPIIKKKRGISPVWILPLVALAVGGLLLFKTIQDAGIEISVYFEDASGIVANKTQVIYKGIPVGVVRKIEVDKTLQNVRAVIEIVREAENGLVEDSRFWLVQPEISANGIRGLETLVSGAYIAVEPGVSTKSSRAFDGFLEPPPIPNSAPGLHLTLRAKALKSIRAGSEIHHKNIVVGTVESYTLEGDNIIISAYIQPEYKQLVHEGSRFWNASGISVSGDVTGLKVHLESLATLLKGGIVFYTPSELTGSAQAENGQEFELYDDFDAARYGIPMTLKLSSGDTIQEGSTKVIYRGLVVGVVSRVILNDDEQNSVTASIVLDPRAESILKSGTMFWIVQPSISVGGVRHLETMIKGNYITFRPGEGVPQTDFVVEDIPPPPDIHRSGVHYMLRGDHAAGLSAGSPVLYKKIQVGEILSVDLSVDGLTTEVRVLIYDEYFGVVREKSVFWSISAVSMRANLNDFELKISSLKTILAGGVAFRNPDPETQGGDVAADDTVFSLYNDYEAAVAATPILQRKGIRFQLLADELGSLQAGSPILYRKVQVGEILDAVLDRRRGVLIDALIYEAHQDIIRTSSRFFRVGGIDVKADISGLRLRTGSLRSILVGGIAFSNHGQGKAVEKQHLFPLYIDEDKAANVGKRRLTFTFSLAQGLQKGLRIKYRGIEIGHIEELRFSKDMNRIIARGLIEPNAETLFREDTLLWLVQPEFRLSGISNLDTLVKGAYLTLRPGAGKTSSEFIVLDRPPPEQTVEKGVTIVLESERLGSLKIGDGLYYRQVSIGRIVGFDLAPSSRKVLIRLNIFREYLDLIRENSRFWNVSGIRFSGGLFSDFKLSTESLDSLVSGGVAMATPDNANMGNRVELSHRFILHDEPLEEWLLWNPSLKLGSRMDGK